MEQSSFMIAPERNIVVAQQAHELLEKPEKLQDFVVMNDISAVTKSLQFLRDFEELSFQIDTIGSQRDKKKDISFQYSENILQQLNNMVGEPENVYLVDRYVRNLIQDMRAEGASTDIDMESFKISPTQYARFQGSRNLLVSHPKDKEELFPLVEFEKRLMGGGERLPQEVFNTYMISTISRKDPQIQDMIDEKLVPINKEDISLFIYHAISEQELQEYLMLLHTGVRKIFKEDFSVPLASLTLPEQFHALSFLKKIKNKDIQKVQNFTKKFGTDGLRTFLSLAQEQEDFGEELMRLDQHISLDQLRTLFKKYSHIVDVVQNMTQFIEREFSKEVKDDQDLLRRIQQKLFSKAQQLLLQASSGSLTKDLEDYNTGLVSYFEAMKQIHASGVELHMDDFISLELTYQGAQQLSLEKRDHIFKQYLADRMELDMVDTYVENFAQRIREGDPLLTCSLVEKHDEMLGFVFFEPYEKDQNGLLLSALTITNEGKRSPFTTKFLEHLCNQQLAHKDLYGYVDDDNHVARNMYRKFGFEEHSSEYKDDDSVVLVSRPAIISQR